MPKDQNAWMQRAGTDGCKNAEEEIQSTLYTSYGDTLGGDLLFVAERNYSWVRLRGCEPIAMRDRIGRENVQVYTRLFP